MNELSEAFQNVNDFYIHYNKIHIGNKIGRKELTKTFIQQKRIIATQVKKQYQINFNANITNNTIENFGSILDLTNEEFLTQLNNDLTKKLQNELSIDKLNKLHSIIKNSNINNFLQKAIDEDSVQNLEQAFEIIADALNLLDKDQGGLGAILLQSINGSVSLIDVGKNLSKLLIDYQNKISKNYRLIKRQSLEAAAKQLRNLSFALENGRFISSGNDLSAKGLSTLLLNGLVSTQIAQGLAFTMSGKAGNLLHKSIIEAVGTQIAVVTSDRGEQTKITGKVDVKAKGVTISLEGYDHGPDSGGITIDIGISSKFYTGQGFNTNLQKPVGTYSSGSGGTLGDALRAIWDDPKDRYLAYNFFAHQMYQQNFNDLIATRQILRLFATSGSESDFVQFMLVNGRIVSIWDIVQYAIMNDLSLSASQNEGGAQGIVLNIPNRPKIFAATQDYDLLDEKGETPLSAAWARSRKINSEINNSRIYAELHLKNLINSISSIKK